MVYELELMLRVCDGLFTACQRDDVASIAVSGRLNLLC